MQALYQIVAAGWVHYITPCNHRQQAQAPGHLASHINISLVLIGWSLAFYIS